MSNSQKSFLSVRSKLIAAVAMLLVASFMVVSSTYAWFTLSTAPEVTGITTQIGANGNLEIALNTNNGTPSNYVGGFTDSAVDKNATWGNIVDLGVLDATGKSAYGLDQIVLKPAMLAMDNTGKIDSEAPLYTPVYGSDGRVEKIDKNGFYGAWNGTGFGLQASDANTGYGVRALGTVSSMTAQQLQFKNAASLVKTSLELFNNTANLSLVENGGALVTLILAGVTTSNPTFTLTDDATTTDVVETNQLAPISALITKLESSLPELEKVIKNFMLLVVANTQAQKSDTEFELIVSAFESNWSSIFTQLKSDAFKTNYTISIGATEGFAGMDVEIPEGYRAYADKFADVAKTYDTIAAKIAAARAAYTTVVEDKTTVEGGATADDGKATWSELQSILSGLMKVDTLNINGKTYTELREMKDNNQMDELVTWGLDVLGAGVKVTMTKDSGVYGDIASVSKNINANFKTDVKISFNGTNVNKSGVSVAMLTNLASSQIIALDPAQIASPPARTEADSDAMITDTYGYVLDFVFRTNAAGSNLKLQQAATDRIYSENTEASDTMGGGSYMEFTTQAGFGVEQVKDLMDNVRLVFANTKTGEILAGGYLDTANAVTGSTVKAAVKLQSVDIITELGGVPLSSPIVSFATGEKYADDNQIITALGQNEATYISVYVYLDGNTIGNADVAALTELSTSGHLNLQFASDAELKPMDYSAFQNQNAGN